MNKAKQLEFDGMGRPNPFAENKGYDPRAEEIEFMFREVEDWLTAEEPRHFDPDFFESLYQQYKRRGTLSDKQYQSLKNVWSKWVDR